MTLEDAYRELVTGVDDLEAGYESVRNLGSATQEFMRVYRLSTTIGERLVNFEGQLMTHGQGDMYLNEITALRTRFGRVTDVLDDLMSDFLEEISGRRVV